MPIAARIPTLSLIGRPRCRSNLAQVIVVRFPTNGSDDLATATLLHQFVKLAIGIGELLDPADMRQQLVVIEGGNLILGHLGIPLSRLRTIRTPNSLRTLQRFALINIS